MARRDIALSIAACQSASAKCSVIYIEPLPMASRTPRDHCLYPMGVVVRDAEFNNIPLERAEFHGGRNYVIRPG